MSLLLNSVKEASYFLAKDSELTELKTNMESFIPNFHQESEVFLFDCFHYFVGLNYKTFNHCNQGLIERVEHLPGYLPSLKMFVRYEDLQLI